MYHKIFMNADSEGKKEHLKMISHVKMAFQN